jgi:hypothetical protein
LPRVYQVENLICWQDSTEVQAFIKQQNIPNITALRNFYETTVQQVWPSFFWKGVGAHCSCCGTMVAEPRMGPVCVLSRASHGLSVLFAYHCRS